LTWFPRLATASDLIEKCDCYDCKHSEYPCSFDCDVVARCEGCQEIAEERTDENEFGD
jgi:hypothetical protein